MPQTFFRLPLARIVTLLVLCVAQPVMAASYQEAQNLLRQGQHAKALDEVNELVSANPKDRGARFLKGVILAEMNRLDEAAAVFTKLTEEAPELPEPYNNLAVIYAQQKQYDKARTALEMSIRTHPTYATAHENLGDLYTQMARQAYDRALQIDSGNANAQAKLKLLRDMMTAGNRTTTTPTTKPVVIAAASSAASVVPTPVTPPTASSSAAASAKAQPPIAAASSSVASSSAKPVAEKPAANASSEVQAALEGWAAAWSRKDVRAYLAAYGKDFQTPGGVNRKTWEAERESRIDKPGAIKVSISGLRIEVNGDKATAQFRQHYSSASLNTATPKTIVMTRQGSRWVIQQERVGR
ncbi:tetratricopeptide repeat protein [Viridibacterium curvum]|uniref:Cds6 C-terminal domain-containing protein n=1 Tax=Viridibacterium curvum TaxID=1101404 RepID=A0ABP9Q944_9RHOO